MSDSLLTKLSEMGIKAIDFTQQSAQSIYAFVEKQAPLLLDEWLAWNFWSSLIWCGFGLIIIIVASFFIKAAHELNQELKWEDRGFPYVPIVISYIAGFVVITGNLDWLKIWIAPRVWILENIKDLIK